MSSSALRLLGSRLRALGYDTPHLRLRMGRVPDRLTAAALVAAERRTGGDALGLAIRFWCLGLPVPIEELEGMLDPVPLAELEASGLVERSDDLVTASVRITPGLRKLLVHDFDRGEQLSREYVLGVSPSTKALASLTPRTPVGRALDIGSGCGAQALRLADHVEEVVATDINDRAAWATRASGALNGVDRLDVRVGNGLDPVAGEQFDLIVSNPPFVVSPSSEMTFRDADTRGDALSRSLVRDVVSSLRPGGVSCVLVNWIVRAGESVTAAAEGWLADLPVKALILQHDALDPGAYAQRWPLLHTGASIDEHRSTTQRWIAELQRLDARFVAAGAVIMERTDEPSAVRVIKMPRRPTNGGGQQVQRMLDAIGHFDGAGDLQLGQARFRLVHGHSIDQRLHYGHSSYAADDAKMRLDKSAGVVGTIPADMLEAIFMLDGERSVSDLAAEAAAARGAASAVVDAALRPVVLELFEMGFLELVASAPD